MRQAGLIQAVFDVKKGSTTNVTAITVGMDLFVYDISYFAPNGGVIRVLDHEGVDSIANYTGIDEDASTLTNVTGLASSIDPDDTTITTWPVVEVRYAEVLIDGETETVRARVPFAMYDRVYEGTRDGEEKQRVLIELTDEYEIVDLLGEPPVYDGTYSTAQEDTVVSATSNTFVSGPLCETTFVAPASGRVIVVVSARILPSADGNRVFVCPEISTATGSFGGEIELAVSEERSLQNGNLYGMRASVVNIHTGLLGGATYFARTMHRQESGAATYTVASRKLQIIPA
jgi:hypothetical protein